MQDNTSEMTQGTRDEAAIDRATTITPEPRADALGASIVALQSTTDARIAELERRVAVAERLASMGQVVAGVAHDFNNLLTTIFANIDLVRGSTPASAGAHLEEIRAAAERGAALTKQLLGLSRPESEATPIEPNEVIQSTLGFLRRVIRPDVALVSDLSTVPPVRMSASHLEQIVANLVLNARDAIALAGRIHVSTRARGDRVEIVVDDDGAGLPAELRDRIFEPFVTTKARGGGFGLASVRRIVESAHGTITASDREPQGARFVVSLPALDGDAPHVEPRSPSTARPVSIAPAGAHVLVVESDAWVRAAAKAVLESLHYHVREAGSVIEAQRIVHFADVHFDLAIIDRVLSGGSGIALGQTLQLQNPGLAVLYTCDWDDGQDLPGPHLSKPYDADELSRRVRETIDAFRSHDRQ